MRAADVHGDDESDRYVGSGGLVLPSSVGDRTRTEVAGCLGCEWRLSSPCATPVDGNPFSGQPTCLSVVRGCPAMAELLRAWFRPASGPWREIGLVCIGPGGPVTVVVVGLEVRERMARAVPPPLPGAQPERGVVAQLPVIFDSGQPADGLHVAWLIGGHPVTLDAAARWRWEFGDGSVLTTADPGGRFPHSSVAHAYRAAGRFTVHVQVTWSARYTVAGLGPFDVPEPVVQSATLGVTVGEGRAVLAVR